LDDRLEAYPTCESVTTHYATDRLRFLVLVDVPSIRQVTCYGPNCSLRTHIFWAALLSEWNLLLHRQFGQPAAARNPHLSYLL